ncbi:hypothetical protein PIB30_057150 [Stylosanthes scabra]|uniref:Uncharacterized protein n=1 Tax=Stylosanthes scabra TaxID=79078 RepID=A0ABU6VKL1_9FABA|nr:hypothetical protein [Stylosanthes scabra]
MAENQPENQEAVVPATGAVQIPRELPFIYRWVANDVLGTPSSLDQQYLDELKLTRVLFDGGDLERRYRVEAARRGERVCFMNLDHPTVPHWLWVNEVMFTEFGVRIPFSEFQQRLLNRASVARRNFIQIHGRQFVVSSCSNTSGKTKKGYMSVRPGKHKKIFTLYEDSFHDFKGRYFKIFPVGNHRPFWLSLEGDGRFPPYWSDQAGFEIRDTADILVYLFAQNNLNPKFLMNNSDEARKAVVEMAGNDVTLARLRRLIRPAPAKSLSSPSTAVPQGGACSAEPEGGSSTNVERASVGEQHVEISSPAEEEISLPPPPSPKRRRSAVEDSSGPKRSRTLAGGSRDFCALDRSFDASGFVESHLLGPKAQEFIRDCDPLESVRWAEWAMIRAATIMKSVEPRLSITEEVERRNARLLADAKTLNLQKMVLEEEKVDAVRAKLKAEEDLKAVKAELEKLEREKNAEADRFQRREEGFQAEVEKFRGLAAEEKLRADLAEASVADLQKQCEDLAEDAKAAVAATEGALKAQLAILLPDFDTDQISFFKDIVDGKVVDPTE